MRLSLVVLGVLVGSFAMIFGEFDDSPGMQGLGLLLNVFIVYKFFEAVRAKRNS
jgi:hypothetical protein